MKATAKQQMTNPAVKAMTAALLAVCVFALLYLRAQKIAAAKAPKDSAVRLSSDIVDVISPAGWVSTQAGDSFKFTNPDGSFIILDAERNGRNAFSPLDRSCPQAAMLFRDVLSKYGILKNVSTTDPQPDRVAGIPAVGFQIKLDDKADGVASFFFSQDVRFTYIASWAGSGSSHSALICKTCKSHVSLKPPHSTPLYVRPSLDSSEFYDLSAMLKNAGDSYRQAKQIWNSAKDSSNDIANAIRAYQASLCSLASTNSGGLVFDGASSLLADAKIAGQARMDKLERMKSEIVQYMKIGDSQMAGKILDDLLSAASFENEMSYKEWALNTKAGMKKPAEE